MDIKKGYLLITDISGYTQFLVESELDHAKEILDSLLRTTIDAVKAPVRVLNTRGDAVLCFVDEDQFLQPQSLLEAMERIYYDFRTQLAFMDINTTCECNACININTLDLKVFLHHGQYIEQDLDGATELQGADVILVNLLMKNTVKETFGLHGYGLISDAAVEALKAEALVADMSPHTESYEHFDDVGMRIWNLPAAWQGQVDKQRAMVTTDDAWIVVERDTPAPQWMAWDYATDEDMKRIYYGMESVQRVDDLGGAVREGSKYHCVHELGDVRFTITDWNPPHHFVSAEVALGIPVQFTMQMEPAEDGGTTMRIMYGEPDVGDKDEVHPVFVEAATGALDRLAELLDSALTAS